MKISTKTWHEVDLELTEEQVAAFDEVSDILTELHDELVHRTQGLKRNGSYEGTVSLTELQAVIDVLNTIAMASSFRFMEEGENNWP